MKIVDGVINLVKNATQDNLSKELHGAMCGEVQAKLKLEFKQEVDQALKDQLEPMVQDLKDHIDKAVNGGNHGKGKDDK